ncbi:MAG: glycine/sarcosine/betaine reductase complex component C subunit alpha [Peptostreptococcus sp.]|uniref:Fatty acid/phospholipid synthesis protein PlsX n=1 Tax=Peptostreptococcus anaerobius TaxID=1261 RepID=A0A135YQE6_9FIRM|nr:MULTISPECIES: glycine/sarcosine/betaine reductase complex component C subunit alpha [Peptostreptococcus]KXI11607.1 fatty acid/phospholipid synthesis protein PlsX [Peptostreptococcus anaerobius]MDB8849579.1 glycine/sarcosine/betaine reductase complex component C subunit alpha [Peptostreptococcus anaerobius]MDB8853279.1 glycine/sarcosine/betaine reductase complex component C subunit alpha [Peptostreptococcus anaerobius]MDB8855207.1 glycine/sarcosine/betaine reductase complex component C subuni
MSNKIISDVLLEVADAIESGNFGKKIRVGLTTLGSEHGPENLINGARLADKGMFEIVLIGKGAEGFTSYEVETEDEMYKKMEELLDAGEIDACVTMHYNFPIGVSTVGRVVTPARAKEMFIATTTGTSATDRVEAMVRNAIYGISTAKACGIERPSVGILNLDGARQVEKVLLSIKDKGYDFDFAESMRADGGSVMRGNDLLIGVPDVMVTDTLTGNLLMKVFSSFNTGGDFEAQGFGYGPGIGEDYDRRVLILSRASGSPVVANALRYAYDIVKGQVNVMAREEYKKALKCGLDKELADLKSKKAPKTESEEVVAPPKEVVTEGIAGVDILDLEDAVKALWKDGIYAESGMGCTGPIVMVSPEKLDKAIESLKKNDFVK